MALTPEERAALTARLTDLQARAVARRDQPGFAANLADIDAEIARIEALLAEPA